MRAGLESALLQRWYGDQPPGFGLRGLAGLYALVLSGRNALYALGVIRSHRLPVPVLVVGNFTAGGAGKTPLLIAIVRYLSAHGYRLGIVSRGYGRQSKQPVQVDQVSSAEICGDEPKLIFERTHCPVFVDSDRVSAAQRAIAVGCNVIVADDGLQHRRLARDVEIEVIDGERRYGNGLLLPAGPLRETPRACDFRIINGNQAAKGEWSMQLRLGDAESMNGLGKRQIGEFRTEPVHAVAGIAHPARFFAALKALGLTLVEHPFPDHHGFAAEDFLALDGTILMTEKDAVKCRSLGLADAWSVPVEAVLDPEFFTALDAKLKQHHA